MFDGARHGLKLQRRLARCGQLDVDCGQQLGVEQSAMLLRSQFTP
jgi:hypothetical protein